MHLVPSKPVPADLEEFLILHNPSYRENAKKLSGIFMDQLNKPLDR
ncbi:unnamed protein product, partial [Allacma fusca]